MSKQWIVVGLLLACFVAHGCGGQSNTVSVETETTAKLNDVFLAYKQFIQDYKKPPSKASELQRYSIAMSLVDVALKENTVLWGVSSVGSDKSVLAYPNDAATKGGFVLLADGTVKKMTAQEFTSAPKAK